MDFLKTFTQCAPPYWDSAVIYLSFLPSNRLFICVRITILPYRGRNKRGANNLSQKDAEAAP
jgi:hypothetical protein